MPDEYMTGYHAGYGAGMENSWPEDAKARIEELERQLAEARNAALREAKAAITKIKEAPRYSEWPYATACADCLDALTALEKEPTDA